MKAQDSRLTRRRFLRATGAAVAAGAVSSCDEPMRRAFLGPFGYGKRETEPFAPPDGDTVDLITHVLNRLTWGVAPGQHQRIAALHKDPDKAIEAFIDEQFAVPENDQSEAALRVRTLEALAEPAAELYEYSPAQLNFELTRAALIRATLSPWQLYEVMVNFWSDHFNIDSSKEDCRWLKVADDREVIRKHALGNFKDLLAASAKSPAMLFYLDGRVNRKRKPDDKPNENYARELLELHTLGVSGGYSQDDVMEVARCLTGWTVGGRLDPQPGPGGLGHGLGRVRFFPKSHDDHAKNVLGVAIPASGGEKDFDKVLEIVTAHPSTAKFVCEKLCRRFISDDPPPAAVEAARQAFSAAGGDIPKTLRAIFATREFRKTRGAKFKRPMHFLVSALRALDADSHCGVQIQQYLRRMGQMPFDYPTPEGYSDRGPDWHSTLLARWDFALRLTRGGLADTRTDLDAVTRCAGGEDGLTRHLLGRKPSAAEQTALAAVKADRAALVLTSPAFQKY